jgi:HD superfamily phosphohydrolase
MEIYDFIHGNIIIDDLAKRIINTEEFQRLRSIKQLGCCNYVFPSAVHTRFEHSLGVYHLSKKYIQILNTDGQFTEEDIKCITIGALIHDIGHGPYSHLFDEVICTQNQSGIPQDHEYRSINLLKHMNKKYGLEFSENDITKIDKIIYPKKRLNSWRWCINKEEPFSGELSSALKRQNKVLEKEGKNYIYQIVSNNNGIDVDRFDYIMRDIKMTGLNYGIEYERIMNHSKIVNGEIVYSEKVKTSIDEFFRIRFIMYKEVYNHHTVRAIEYMMKDFIKGMDKIMCIKNMVESEDWEGFIRLNDSIIDSIYHYKKMINHIHVRELWPDFLSYGECNFWKVSGNDASQNKIEYIDKLIELIHNIRIRNIYKSVGEIISDSKIELDGYNTENIIVDSVKLSHNGKVKCKYIQNRETVNKSLTIQNKDQYVTTIYYKAEQHKDEAEQLFDKLK